MRVVGLLALVMLHGCAGPGPSAELEVRAVMSSFEEAERELDLEALLGFLAPDFHMFQDAQRVDYEGTVAQMRASIPSLEVFEPVFEDVRIQMLDERTALVSMVFRDRVVDGSGNESRQWGASTLVWRQRGDRWLLIYADSDHYPAGEEPGE